MVFQLAQADNFGKAAAVVTLMLIVAVVFGRKWIAQRDEPNSASIGGVLLGLSLIAIAAVLIAAITGPHPS